MAALRALRAVLLGLGLGGWYGFLRPLRPRFTWVSDALFLLGCGWAWIYLAFGICGGDLRIGYLAGAAAGAVLWEMTLGRVLRPVWYGFWGGIRHFLEILGIPLKKFSDFLKKMFASAEKWVTIK